MENFDCLRCHIPVSDRDCSKCVLGFDEARINTRGAEVGNPEPVALVLDSRTMAPSFIEQIKLAVRNEFSQLAAGQGHETFDESNDFHIPDADDSEELSPYQTALMKEEFLDDGRSVVDNKEDSSDDSQDDSVSSQSVDTSDGVSPSPEVASGE